MSNLIAVQYQNTEVFFHNDAWLNATSIAKKFNKQPRDYLKIARTKDYIEAVKRIVLTEEKQLVNIVHGGEHGEQGTWLHPKLAIDFARWLSPDFAVWCDSQIEKLLHKTKYGLTALPEPPTITKAQQGELFNLVGNKADSSDKPHAYFWSRFNKHFKLASYKNLPAEQFDEAMEYMRKLEGDGDDSLVTITRKDFQQLCEMATKPKPITLMIGNAQEGERYLITSQGGRILFQEVAPEAHILTSEQIENNIHDVVPGKELISADLYNKMKGELLA